MPVLMLEELGYSDEEKPPKIYCLQPAEIKDLLRKRELPQDPERRAHIAQCGFCRTITKGPSAGAD